MRAILFISFLLISEFLSAQNFSVSLSENHLKKLQRCQSGHKRLKQYFKFYRKDSLDHSRKQDKKFRKELDSAYTAKLKRDKLQRRLARQGINLPDQRRVFVDCLNKEIGRCWRTLNDTSLSDSLRILTKMKARKLATEKVKLDPAYQHVINTSAGGDSLSWKRLVTDVPGLDSLSALFDSSADEFFATVEHTAEAAILQAGGVSLLGDNVAKTQQLMEVPPKYREHYQRYANIDSVQRTAGEFATAEAIKRFEENAPIKAAQQQMGKLLSRYRQFSNSADLRDGVKHTSMKGRTLTGRLMFGGNFSIISTSPLSIDISPQLGYKFTTRFVIGLGMNYRCTDGDSIKSSYFVSPRNTSLKAFLSYDVIRSCYAFGEWEKSGIKKSPDDRTSRQWKDNYFIGLGKRFLVHPKLYFTMTAVYNLNGEDENPVHPGRFQVRMGFQLSESAGKRPATNYNPN